MILGVLGKGGSGKTTLATALVRFLEAEGKSVLAIDADHNMDLAYNLGAPEHMPYLGQSLAHLLEYTGASSYRDIFEHSTPPRFTLSPKDPYTKVQSVALTPQLHLMVSGPHTNDVLYDASCSHSLGTPLKVYLPYLSLTEAEACVVDEKAGLDGVGTGVTTGFSAAIVVAEPTPHSIKAARGIVELLMFYGTPFRVLLTKYREPKDRDAAQNVFGDTLIGAYGTDMSSGAQHEVLSSICAFGAACEAREPSRVNRTLKKVTHNKHYAQTHYV